MTAQEIVDTYERMINTNELVWIDVDHSTLPKSTSSYCQMWLDYFKIQYKVATLQLGGTILFKIEDDFVKYLHHDPEHETHMWADEGFHSHIDNNQALAKLCSRTGIPESETKKMFDAIDVISNIPNN